MSVSKWAMSTYLTKMRKKKIWICIFKDKERYSKMYIHCFPLPSLETFNYHFSCTFYLHKRKNNNAASKDVLLFFLFDLLLFDLYSYLKVRLVSFSKVHTQLWMYYRSLLNLNHVDKMEKYLFDGLLLYLYID